MNWGLYVLHTMYNGCVCVVNGKFMYENFLFLCGVFGV